MLSGINPEFVTVRCLKANKEMLQRCYFSVCEISFTVEVEFPALSVTISVSL